ncbi:MAG: cupin domain-containing protein [Myxococcales bacterium]|nr:cupin domain-containing protein [Myxococcales bacterium]
MPAPAHHVSQSDLLGYVTGSLSAPVELWVACHLTYCPACRAEVELLEAVGGALLQGSSEEPPALPVLPDVDTPPPSAPEPLPVPADAVFPSPLRQRAGSLQELSFRDAGYGLRIAKVGREEGLRTFVVDFPAGMRVPRHGHRGIERGLVLRGGYAEGGQHFAVGDVDVHEGPDDQHSALIDDDGPCTALFVTEGPATAQPPWLGWLADWWLHR